MREERRARSTRLAIGTLACPACDAPVLPSRPVAPSETMACPYCHHGARAHAFLSLAGPLRPARVEVRVVRRAFV